MAKRTLPTFCFGNAAGELFGSNDLPGNPADMPAIGHYVVTGSLEIAAPHGGRCTAQLIDAVLIGGQRAAAYRIASETANYAICERR